MTEAMAIKQCYIRVQRRAPFLNTHLTEATDVAVNDCGTAFQLN